MTLGRWLLIGSLAFLVGCPQRFVPEPEGPQDLALKDNDELAGEPCNDGEMVQLTLNNGHSFCIDRFEATLDGGSLGNADQAAGDGASYAIDGTTTAKAMSALQELPATSISWYQARAACLNAGKRLCTVDEWERACRGPDIWLYPYGDVMDDQRCNGFFQIHKAEPAKTGSFRDCGSAEGVYDLSGNVEEWTAGAAELVPGSGVMDARAIRGGSYASNANALACVGPDFVAAPAGQEPDRGFRCCMDAP